MAVQHILGLAGEEAGGVPRAKRTGGITGFRAVVSFIANCNNSCGPDGTTVSLTGLDTT